MKQYNNDYNVYVSSVIYNVILIYTIIMLIIITHLLICVRQ